MATQNNMRIIAPKLMHNISILYQNGEITTEEKNKLCNATNKALTSNEFGDLGGLLTTLRFGTMFPEVVDECIQLVSFH